MRRKAKDRVETIDTYSTINWINEAFTNPSYLHATLERIRLAFQPLNKELDFEYLVKHSKSKCSKEDEFIFNLIDANKILKTKFIEVARGVEITSLSISEFDLYQMLLCYRQSLANITKPESTHKSNVKKRTSSPPTTSPSPPKTPSKKTKTLEILPFSDDLERNIRLMDAIKKTERNSLYNRFNCSITSDFNEITKQYRSMSLILHPDKNGDLKEPYREKVYEAFKIISYSYEVLYNSRKKYDTLLYRYNYDFNKVNDYMRKYPI